MKSNKTGNLFLTLFLTIFLALGLFIVLDEVRENQDIRTMAGSSSISSKFFCPDSKLCDDGRCIGETWRECKPCPTGKARVAYKASCEETTYSECNLDGTICDD